MESETIHLQSSPERSLVCSLNEYPPTHTRKILNHFSPLSPTHGPQFSPISPAISELSDDDEQDSHQPQSTCKESQERWQ